MSIFPLGFQYLWIISSALRARLGSLRDPKGQYFNENFKKCDPYVDCSQLKHTASYKWSLDKTTNECRKIKPGFKFQLGLGIIMICAMVAGLLYLLLDDRFFCLRTQRVELAASEKSPPPKSVGQKPGLAKATEDD